MPSPGLPADLPLAALEAVANSVVITDAKGAILWVNPAFTRMTGYAPVEVVGQNPRVLKSGAHEPSFYRQLWNTILAGDVWAGEMVNRRKDGSTYVEEQTITPVRDAHGAISHFIAIKQDITARTQAEAALRESEERYRLLAENLTDVLLVFDVNLRLVYVSPSVRRQRGFSPDEVLAQTMEERLTPGSLAVARQVLAEEMAAEQSGQADPSRSRTLDLELPRRDGSTVWTEVNVSSLRDADGRPQGLIAVSRDITTRKRVEAAKEQMEEQLRQAQKMEAIGLLAGGIAHDFNNLLTVIIGRTQITAWRLPEGDPARRDLDLIASTAERAAALTRQLLAFSRQQVLQPRVVDLNAIVGQVERLLQRVIGENIALTTVRATDIGAIKADPSQVEQVLLNLAVNSRDAMPEGGRLTIETANADLDEIYARAHLDLRPGAYVMLAVSDTGHGMDAATRARIFDPFFTTKAPGRGTGLGLATVYGIITQSGGHILVYSEVGHGTTFRVLFPRVLEAPAAAGPAPVAGPGRRATETILLVEDDEQVRALARQVLTETGYVVLDARGPAEALELATGHDRIDLLVTDVIMPGMNGLALAKRVSERHPRTRALYISGYTATTVAQQGAADHPDIVLLQKPFTVSALTTKVREVLDTPA